MRLLRCQCVVDGLGDFGRRNRIGVAALMPFCKGGHIARIGLALCQIGLKAFMFLIAKMGIDKTRPHQTDLQALRRKFSAQGIGNPFNRML